MDQEISENTETSALIHVSSFNEATASNYGGVLFKCGASPLPKDGPTNTAGINWPADIQQQEQNSSGHPKFSTLILNSPSGTRADNNESAFDSNPQTSNGDIDESITKSFTGHAPRARTSSERFHCHVGGAEESDDDEVCAATTAGKRHSGNTNGRRRVSATTKRAMRALWISVVVCVLFMVCEVIGGIWAQSLAIITDAAHLLTDLASMLISLFSLYMASRPASQRMSFGWYRAEVVGAFVSVFMIWVVTGILVYLAIERMITAHYDIDAPVMAITAGLGVLVNIVMGVFLYFGGHSHSHLGAKHSHSHGNGNSHGHEHSEENGRYQTALPHSPAQRTNSASSITPSSLSSLIPQRQQLNSVLLADQEPELGPANEIEKPKKSSTNINVRAAFIHVLGDLIQSVGVLIAALLILWKESLAIMDPVCTLLFSIIVVSTTVYIIRDALVVLLEGRPSSIDFRHVFEALEQIEGVRKVHDLRIWALTMDRVAISVHLEISSNARAQTILKNTTLMLRRDFNVHESTVQIEGWRPDSANCLQCIVPER